MSVPNDVLSEWYQSAEPLLDREAVQEFFAVPDYSFLTHHTSECDDVPEDYAEFMTYLSSITVMEVPHLAEHFALSSGGIWVNSQTYAPYVVGNGNFESSFPLLIYRKNSEQVLNNTYLGWQTGQTDHV